MRKFILIALVSVFFASTSLLADSDDSKPGKKKVAIKPVTDKIYLEECGSCHFAYHAELMPESSWKALIEGLKTHFGEDASMEPAPLKQVTEYLLSNAADYSQNSKARAMFKSAKGQVFARISEVPFFLKEHHEIGPDVIARPKIKTWANCEACHPTAANGVYGERYIVIPK
ncbi:MAG: hypothetical protein A2527_05545 [Candidatus Lambdaproteobacteria bacterium RIFOXYD2_FULL_50_16]|uniref:Cytochrome C n=1 Tax=Candidatus Lambdaproteobacteria bacterium RIFOXYD2_FULL_50_16 TaxID=1817772 RepID=A0A1F6G948_9PROT|nr:MAG: hypothetical protein A2527_05545 [Candidatus Lambdaproteobacteria bacterium RIFOXYD2_FULL_50_16]